MNKARRVKVKTVLIACEGEGEKECIQFFKSMQDLRGTGHTIQLRTFHGGGLKHMVQKTKHSPIKSTTRYLFLDQFTVKKEKGFHVPKSIRLIKSDPCLEAVICHILGSKKTFEGMSEKDCKRYLKKEYGCDKIERKWLEQNITKEMLGAAIESIPCLKKIQQILQGSVPTK